ncbi:MAG: Dabb family protein [Bacteroidota bacterium]|nr:Dabb family protein [Bacteroidota bacterium]
MQETTNRRAFLSKAAKTAALSAVTIPALAAAPAADKVFIHHVYFWLKNPESQEDKDKLIAGLKKLATVKTINSVHIGVPAATNRDVIDRSYSVSWCLFFANKADQDSYQTDPIHLNFVKECSSLWTKVIVYDSEDV